MDGVVGGFGYANPKNVDDASSRGFFPRAENLDENLGENLFLSDGNARVSARAASPGKASLDAFVAATSAEAVSLVGRAALAIGNAVVDGIEGTADFVHHAAKQADRIANKAASPTPGGRGGGLRGALAVLSPSGGNRRSGSVAPPVKQTVVAKTRVLGLGATGLVSPLKKTGVGGGFRSPAKPSSRAGRAAAPAAAARADDSGDEWGWAAGSPTKDELRGAVSSAVAHFRRELEASRAENASLRKDLCGARAALAAAAEEAEGLKQQNLGLQRRQAQREREREGSDPLAEQVRCQLETLVAEKAKLAQENNELWRENESLQELLMHSNMATEAESLYSAGGALADLVEKPAPPQTHFESKLAEATTTSGPFSEATMSGSPTLEDTRISGDDELLLERREVDAVRRDGPATESAGALKVSVSVEEVSTERGAAPAISAFETGVPSETAAFFPSTDAEPSALEEPSLDADFAAVAETPAARVETLDASGEGKENVEKENVSESPRSAAPEPKGASGGKKKKGKKGKR